MAFYVNCQAIHIKFQALRLIFYEKKKKKKKKIKMMSAAVMISI